MPVLRRPFGIPARDLTDLSEIVTVGPASETVGVRNAPPLGFRGVDIALQAGDGIGEAFSRSKPFHQKIIEEEGHFPPAISWHGPPGIGVSAAILISRHRSDHLCGADAVADHPDRGQVLAARAIVDGGSIARSIQCALVVFMTDTVTNPWEPFGDLLGRCR